MRTLDFLSEPPSNYIFQNETNKTNFGGLLFIIYLIIMFIISFVYIIDYIINDKYNFESTTIFNEFNSEFNYINFDDDSKNVSESDINPSINFGFELLNSVNENLSDNYLLYDAKNKKFIDRDYSLIKRKVSDLSIEILYRCQNKSYCPMDLDEKDLLFNLRIKYKGFKLDHQSNGKPLETNNDIYFSNDYQFLYGFITFHYLEWGIIKYKEEKGISRIFDNMFGKTSELTAGYIESSQSFNLLVSKDIYGFQDEDSNYHYYKILGLVQMRIPYKKYVEYNRKKITELDVISTIGALFSTLYFPFTFIFSFYSKNFTNYKILENVLQTNYISHKIRELKEKDTPKEKTDIMNDINNLSPLINDEQKLVIIDDEEKSNEKKDINIDDENKHFKKLTFVNFFMNNFYYKCCGEIRIQEIISLCNEILAKYMSIDHILYNQIKLENLFEDYKWNTPSLNNIKNNEYITKLLNKT